MQLGYGLGHTIGNVNLRQVLTPTGTWETKYTPLTPDSAHRNWANKKKGQSQAIKPGSGLSLCKFSFFKKRARYDNLCKDINKAPHLVGGKTGRERAHLPTCVETSEGPQCPPALPAHLHSCQLGELSPPGAWGITGCDGHSHLMSKRLHSSCLISPARSSVQLSLLSQILYCFSWRHLRSWTLQCCFSSFCSLSMLPRHSWVMMSRTCTPKTGLHSHPEQLFPS